MNSHQTRAAATKAGDATISRGYTTPRRTAIIAHHTALMLDEDRTQARRDYNAQLAIVEQLQDRLNAAKEQLHKDRRFLDDIEQDASKADHTDDIANARHIATRTAARTRATSGLPAIRPIWPCTQAEILRMVTLPSKTDKYPSGSAPRNVSVENAWRRRAKFARCKPEHSRPAVIQAFARWTSAMNRDALTRARSSRAAAIAYGLE